MTSTKEILERARLAKGALRAFGEEDINRALLLIAEELLIRQDEILRENEKDVKAARENLSSVMIDRLMLSEDRISAMANGIRELVALPYPVGRVLSETTRPNGLVIDKVVSPMGVVAIIYESRPNVTSDAAALALKSSNVCVLRGGKEAYRSAAAITLAMREGLKKAGLPVDAIQLIEDTTRESAYELMKARGYVDLLIPRGGKGLISACVENATVPCIETGTGICHVYVDKYADTDMALSIVDNAKTSRPSVCNAAEVCLVHEDIANEFLPKLKARLCDGRKNPVEFITDKKAFEIIGGTPAGDKDFDTEFLDYKLALKIVSSVKEAVEHIACHSTMHSEAIITQDDTAKEYFTANVDSAAVYVNASTRFTDGGVFGLGCEMGISTQKMHARGPMGIMELCSYKYVIRGNGQVR
ncbi:MAG: glutamate-5-semialdehyde dehydrogenase [Clostridia bacterium]|nr:glutamate-5-semialdehyde dehydrogenase [Clostridia bacterium]